MRHNLAKSPIDKQLYLKARTEMMLDFIDNHTEFGDQDDTERSLMQKIAQIRCDAMQVSSIAMQAEAMGIKIIASDVIKARTSPEAWRRLILEYTASQEVTAYDI